MSDTEAIKASARSEIRRLAAECAEPGWNGEAAEPTSKESVAVACAFIDALPAHVPLPEFAPEPDGSISLDWIESRSRVLSLSVGPGRRVPYAWLDGTDRSHGVADFDGSTIPPEIVGLIARIKGS